MLAYIMRNLTNAQNPRDGRPAYCLRQETARMCLESAKYDASTRSVRQYCYNSTTANRLIISSTEMGQIRCWNRISDDTLSIFSCSGFNNPKVSCYRLLPLYYYRAMHYTAKRGIAIACRPSVCPSVRDIAGSGAHRLEILESTCTDN